MNNLLQYAKKVENDMYSVANTRVSYQYIYMFYKSKTTFLVE